ncbi:RelA/SpoT family protein [Elongatibacter sediminis]|uniref:GTP pyrophosphokinase n=1 Tax=Elongatibacter sediminis TaxID=3119006 RepID=A0AAW9RNG8_9GAMM
MGTETADNGNLLRDWLSEYRESVGSGADECEVVLDLIEDEAQLDSGGRARMLELLGILQALSPDPVTVSCALVLAAGQSGDVPASLHERLPAAVGRQVSQLQKLKQFEIGQGLTDSERSAEGLRRLLLALVNDVRVVLVDLAWQLVLLRNVAADSEQARALARETMLIHAPLANRLGVWQVKWELEDRAFRHQDPAQYQRIAKLVAERRAERERFIEAFMEKLSTALHEAGIRASVKGRPKHIYSIWKKMQRKGIDFHELFDVRAVRVLVDDVPDCYSVLGLVHTLWQPIPGEFDDYITTPKGNNYQSLHTAVSDASGRAVEVQIRTLEMHEHAELGVAAHWRYKEGGPRDPGFENKIAVMRQLLEASGDELDDESLLDSFRSATSEDRVYVLTPRGQVVDLAAGSTVLDFAYSVHTEVGHRCRGAKVNGRIVPLTHGVKTGDRVEILTAKQAGPSRDWLNPRLGYIRGGRARSKVRQWFKKESREDNLRAGREAVETEARRMGLEPRDMDAVAARFSQGDVEDLYVAVGSGDLTVGQVISAVERRQAESAQPSAEDLLTRTPVRQRGRAGRGADDVTIEGVGNLMTTMAKCCQPVPGDPVVGYVTRSRGVTIHREDCPQALRWQREQNPRLLQVRWGEAPTTRYPVSLEIRAFDRRELIRDISNVLATSDVQVTDINSRLDDMTDEVTIRLVLRVRDYEQLSELLNRLSSVPNVLGARRLAEGAARD